MNARLAHVIICLLAVAVCIAAASLGALPPGTRATPYIFIATSLFALMLAALWSTSAAEAPARWAGRWLLLAAVASRLVLLPASSVTTHDADRYLWDGAVFLSGTDPWAVRPDDARLSALRQRWPVPEEHASVATLYPPLAVFLFALCAAAGPRAAPWVWAMITTAASLLALLGAARLLEERGLSRLLPLAAFSPILLLEAGVGRHLDVLCAAALAFGLYRFARGDAFGAGLLVGLGGALKLLPLVALVPLLLAPAVRRRWLLPLGASAALVASYGAVLSLGMVPFGSLPYFFAKWRFGSPLWLLGSASAAEALAATVLVGCLAYVMWLSRRGRTERAVLFSLLAVLWATPVVFPWYASTAALVASAAPSATALAWLAALPFSYEVIDAFDLTGRWAPARWPLALVLFAALLGWAFEVRGDFSGRRRAGGRARAPAPTAPAPAETASANGGEARRSAA